MLSTTSASPRAVSSPWKVSSSSVTPGGSARIKRQGAGITSRQPPLDRSELRQLGHQDCPVRVIGALEPEILPPVEQDIGCRIVVSRYPAGGGTPWDASRKGRPPRDRAGPGA